MNLFIDTNIFLSFYHLSSDDLEELRKLGVLLDKKKVTLLLPQQVVDEFHRNREVKIADALKRFRDDRLNDQFPQICKEYEEYGRMRTAITEFKLWSRRFAPAHAPGAAGSYRSYPFEDMSQQPSKLHLHDRLKNMPSSTR